MKKTDNVSRFETEEDGAITVLALFLSLASFIIGGVALDVAFAFKSRTELQIAADAAAHAALYTRQDSSVADAKAAAIQVAENTLPTSSYGDVLNAGDVVFGSWDEHTQTFAADPNAKDAVMVVTERLARNGNAVQTFLLNFVGVQEFDVRSGAVYRTYLPACLREGFVADGTVDLQSNNGFSDGFCIHSNAFVSVNSNNSWETGTVVSMPDKALIDMPNSGYKTNVGLEEALRDQKYKLRIIDRLPEIMDGLAAGDTEYVPDYISSLAAKTISKSKIDGSRTGATKINGQSVTLQERRIYKKSCGGGNKTLTIEGGATLRNLVIVTDCKVKFGAGVVLENVVIATKSTSAKSITAASGLQIGRSDACSPGGGAQLLTMGSMDFPADLKVFGGQLIAKQDIAFAANANGIEGASLIAGGEIDGTSNMNMGFCGSGMEDNFEVPYFQLAA